MTLTEAKEAVRIRGAEFGDVFLQIEEHNREHFKDWWLHAAGVPNLVARAARAPQASGNMCKCGGMMVRTGTCETCQSCGESSGGCG